jgi:hypothetical protein
MKSKKPSLIDIPVLLIFFTRVEQTAEVFHEKKKLDRANYIYIKMAQGQTSRMI